jgi:hypothetical protein
MSDTNLLTSFKLANLDVEDTARKALVPTQPSTPLPDKSAAIDLTLNHTTLIESFKPTPFNHNPSFNVIALHSSANMNPSLLR